MRAEHEPLKVREVVEYLKKFHGHLGPYLIIGARMAEVAITKLGFDPFKMKAVVYTGKTPPISCMIDGIQFISGCTLGKGNISVVDDGVPKAEFILGERTIKVRLQKPINLEGCTKDDVQRIAMDLVNAPVETFLEIE